MMHADTLPDLFRLQADRFGARVAVRFKKHGLYHDLRWDEYREQVTACAAALVAYGIEPDERIAILSENRLEWLIADMAILCAAAVNVPLHAPLSAQQAHFQLENSGTRFIFVSNRAQLDKIEQIRAMLPELKEVVVFDETPARDAISWQGFLQRGRMSRAKLQEELDRREAHLTHENLATIIYTSGTTGNPKGVMLTHRNLVSNALAFTQVSVFGPDNICFNWLPFSHIYARTVDIYVPLAIGTTLCLAENAETVVANLGEVQPTNFSGVPRFYEKVLSAVQHDDPKILGQRLRHVFGPRIDFLGSGGAPLPVGIARAYQNAGLLLLQGYGLTESSPVISFNRKDCYKIESVGKPIPGVEVKIGADGEILTRGPHVMKGYWKNPHETAHTLVDGWLHTGDLGRLDEDGFLYITGRKKELLVLSNGKKVIPSYLEGILLADPCIDQVVIHGEGRNFLTALIVPHFANLAHEMKTSGAPEALASDPKVRAFLEARIEKALTAVSSWEQIKKTVILAQPFSVANDEMTVSLKLRRSVIFERHRQELEGLYRDS